MADRAGHADDRHLRSQVLAAFSDIDGALDLIASALPRLAPGVDASDRIKAARRVMRALRGVL